MLVHCRASAKDGEPIANERWFSASCSLVVYICGIREEFCNIQSSNIYVYNIY